MSAAYNVDLFGRAIKNKTSIHVHYSGALSLADCTHTHMSFDRAH